MSLKIRFRNFWKNAGPQQNLFFVPLFAKVFESHVTVVRDPNIHVDLEIISVFKAQEKFSSKVYRRIRRVVTAEVNENSDSLALANRRIWFTGENKRPPINEQFDSYLSYELEGLIPRVHYLPLWVLSLDHFNSGKSHGFTSMTVDQEQLMQHRTIDRSVFELRKFCCSFIGNPVGFRLGILNEISKLKSLDTFGAAFDRVISDKSKVAPEYNFSFAFENNLYPGYVTEKLLESYVSLNVPIYWGDDVSGYFNPNSFINLHDYKTVESFVERVLAIASNFELYEEMYAQPLLQRRFSIDDLIEKLRSDLM